MKYPISDCKVVKLYTMSKTEDRENLTLSSAVVSVKVKLEKGHSSPHPNPQGRAGHRCISWHPKIL